jgi:hypothetical protein
MRQKCANFATKTDSIFVAALRDDYDYHYMLTFEAVLSALTVTYALRGCFPSTASTTSHYNHGALGCVKNMSFSLPTVLEFQRLRLGSGLCSTRVGGYTAGASPLSALPLAHLLPPISLIVLTNTPLRQYKMLSFGGLVYV